MNRPDSRPMSWRTNWPAAARCGSAALVLAALAACTSDGQPPAVAATDDRLYAVVAPAAARPAAPDASVEPVEPTITTRPTPLATQAPAPPATQAPAPPATMAPALVPTPAPVLAPALAPVLAPALAPGAEPPPPAEPSPPVKPPPIELAGLNGDKVAELLGRPHHVWREPPAAVWQYRATDCVLHVFFYPAAGEPLRVVHVTRRRPGGPAQPTNGAINAVPSDFSDALCRRVEAAG